MHIDLLLTDAVEKQCSDIHITVGRPPMIRKNGIMVPIEGYPELTPEDTRLMTTQILDSEDKRKVLEEEGDADCAYVIHGVSRFRVNAYKQKNHYGLAIRVLNNTIPTMQELHLPPILVDLANKPRGLVLVTGPTGSGKSTTLASMINHINMTRQGHILTIEDPIEYVHEHKNCIIHQREIGEDTSSFGRALRSALREDPDVILLGEMRDLETIQAAITAAETGHLVLSTLHTKGAANTVDRMIDIFPSAQQKQIRIQLANVLEGVITQNLVKKADQTGRALAMEILVMNDAVRHMIRDEKVHQISSAMQLGIKQGMQPMDYHLARLVKEGTISLQEAQSNALKQEDLMRYLTLH